MNPFRVFIDSSTIKFKYKKAYILLSKNPNGLTTEGELWQQYYNRKLRHQAL